TPEHGGGYPRRPRIWGTSICPNLNPYPLACLVSTRHPVRLKGHQRSENTNRSLCRNGQVPKRTSRMHQRSPPQLVRALEAARLSCGGESPREPKVSRSMPGSLRKNTLPPGFCCIAPPEDPPSDHRSCHPFPMLERGSRRSESQRPPA